MNALTGGQETQEPATRNPADFANFSVGENAVAYTSRDAILYALAVGARADQLDLVDETRLQVLPTFALPLTQWALDALVAEGAWDPNNALHGGQELKALQPLPREGSIDMCAHVATVRDKGTAAVYEIVVESDYFVATWTIFAPGRGGFGGDRGPSAPAARDAPAEWEASWEVPANQAALYRLCGDWHRIHIDPAAARVAGMKAPILHGLATLASTVVKLADAAGVSPATLRSLSARFAAPVYPGDSLTVQRWGTSDFAVQSPNGTAISVGSIAFDPPGAAEQSSSNERANE